MLTTQTILIISCDHCESKLAELNLVLGYTLEDIIEEAEQQAAFRKNGKDYCVDCAELAKMEKI